jgi:WD40 repeat protein
LEHLDTIHDSPSHIYHSALPFSPSSSWLYKHCSAELSKEVKVLNGLPAEWGKCSCTVFFNSPICALSFRNNTIAVGSKSGNITILDAITGNQAAVLSIYKYISIQTPQAVGSIIFSSDGKLLVSSYMVHIRIWDMQTGGVIMLIDECSASVSISADCTRIASVSENQVHLWDTQTGEFLQAINQETDVTHVSFSPKAPQCLLSICGNRVQQWDTNGHKIGPTYDGSYVAFSPDSAQLVLCHEKVVTVQDSSSGVIVAEFHVPGGNICCCCFSPDGRLVAIAVNHTAYVWDISSSEPHLIETFIGHTESIISLVFSSSSSLISASEHTSVKFWQIGVLPENSAGNDPMSTYLTSADIKSITLQSTDDITITSDSDGVIKIWEISTGLCKASFPTPAKHFHKGDVQLINGRLVFVWCEDSKINIWDVEKEVLSTIHTPSAVEDLRISGDGSRVFCLLDTLVQVWSIQTGEFLTKVSLGGPLNSGHLYVDGSRVWAYHSPKSEGPEEQLTIMQHVMERHLGTRKLVSQGWVHCCGMLANPGFTCESLHPVVVLLLFPGRFEEPFYLPLPPFSNF